ncbi:MAG: phage tail protein, partial [Deltaproteobacteria bacterium]|nr:phage tail protein [Deltaproteobacteria bacterium]
PTTYGKITLKRGVTTDQSFYNWVKESVGGKGRRNGTITLLDEAGNTVKSWQFVRAWPCKWEGGSFDTSSSAALIETLEIAHEGLMEFLGADTVHG